MHKTHTNITHTNASTRSLGCASAQRTLMLTVGGTQRHSIQHRIYKFFFSSFFVFSLFLSRARSIVFFFLSFFSLCCCPDFFISLSLSLLFHILSFCFFFCFSARCYTTIWLELLRTLTHEAQAHQFTKPP